MIKRIVKLNIIRGKEVEVEAIYKQAEGKIRSMPGCLHLELFKHQVGDENSFFTISDWRSEDDLEFYRKSELFLSTWSKFKPLFSSKASAWSLTPVIV